MEKSCVSKRDYYSSYFLRYLIGRDDKKSLANNRETDFKTVKDAEKTLIYFIYL